MYYIHQELHTKIHTYVRGAQKVRKKSELKITQTKLRPWKGTKSTISLIKEWMMRNNRITAG